MHTKLRRILPVADEIGFIMKTWGREERKNHSWRYPDRLFYPNFGKIMVEIAARSDCIVACNPDDINQIQGFAIGKAMPEHSTMLAHFVYVRPEFRRLGLAKDMLAALGYDISLHELVYTHDSKTMDKILIKDRAIVFNPHCVYGLIK